MLDSQIKTINAIDRFMIVKIKKKKIVKNAKKAL